MPMNEIIFSQSFSFNQYRINRAGHTDNRNGKHAHFLAYMRNGFGHLAGEDRVIDVKPGDFFYIPDAYPYQSWWRGDDIVIWDSYAFSHFPKSDGGLYYPMQVIPSNQQALEILEKLSTNMQVNCISIGLMYQLLGILEQNMIVAPESRKHAIVSAAENYMYQHITFLAADVARHCGVSESGLYAAFREVRGYPPSQAKHRMLIEKAIQLLTVTDLSIEAISEQLGFSSSIYFRKIFAEQTGKTPRTIRKERRL